MEQIFPQWWREANSKTFDEVREGQGTCVPFRRIFSAAKLHHMFRKLKATHTFLLCFLARRRDVQLATPDANHLEIRFLSIFLAATTSLVIVRWLTAVVFLLRRWKQSSSSTCATSCRRSQHRRSSFKGNTPRTRFCPAPCDDRCTVSRTMDKLVHVSNGRDIAARIPNAKLLQLR